MQPANSTASLKSSVAALEMGERPEEGRGRDLIGAGRQPRLAADIVEDQQKA